MCVLEKFVIKMLNSPAYSNNTTNSSVFVSWLPAANLKAQRRRNAPFQYKQEQHFEHQKYHDKAQI